MSGAREVFWVFFRLGLTAFGGPIAHLAYFRAECVENRRWLDEKAYADLVALCQFLPGPASSQTALILGLRRAGLWGAVAAWTAFTLPSAAAMIVFALGLRALDAASPPFLHGLKIVAVAVVAQAVWTMARKFCVGPIRAGLALGAAALVLGFPSAPAQIAALLAAGTLGWLFLPAAPREPLALALPGDRRLALGAAVLFLLLLFVPPWIDAAPAQKFAAFYRAGALVFGGGHVVLPLLRDAVVPAGWIGDPAFLAGYGAAQALPGPLFAFAAFLGTAMDGPFAGLLALLAIYLPSFLLLAAVLPFWSALSQQAAIRAALIGVNAAVVGFLAAALYAPVWTSAIFTPRDFTLALAAFLALTLAKAPPWLVVALGAAGAQLLGA